MDDQSRFIRKLSDPTPAKMLEAWSFSDETGHYEMLSNLLDSDRTLVELSGDLKLIETFQNYRRIADDALAVETKCGRGSMRKMEHPCWARFFAAQACMREWEASGLTGWVEPRSDNPVATKKHYGAKNDCANGDEDRLFS